MQRIVQACVDGCGRVRIFKCPDGFSPIPVYDHVAEEAALEQARLAGIAREIVSRRVQLRNDIEAIKTADGFTDAYIDDDNNPATPGVLKRLWNRIFG